MNNIYECITYVTHVPLIFPRISYRTYLLCLASSSLLLPRNYWGFLDPANPVHYRFPSLCQQILVLVQSLQLPGQHPDPSLYLGGKGDPHSLAHTQNMNLGENVSLVCSRWKNAMAERDVGKILQVLSEGWSQGICRQQLVWLVGRGG